MPSVKLKPCPFCGEKPRPAATGFYPDPPVYYIYCDGCGASGRMCNTEKEAIAAWNRRANDD